MKLKIYAVATIALLMNACSKTDVRNESPVVEEVATKAKPKVQNPVDFTVASLFPEGVVYDPVHNRFLVSSITQGTIGSVGWEGTYMPFIQDAALVSTTGLEVDAAHKRLLVSNTSLDGSVAQLAIYDLRTGNRIHLVNLAALDPGAPHFINDVALDPQGNAYATDSYSPIIYKVDREGHASIFFQDAAFATPPGSFGFNGIEYHHNGFLLVDFTATNQLFKIPVGHPSGYARVQLDASLNGPDGMLLSKDGKQLVVVNNAGGGNGQVLSFKSNDKWATATLAESYSTGPVFPTTATSDGKTVYALYSYISLLIGGQPHDTFTIQPIPFTNNRPF